MRTAIFILIAIATMQTLGAQSVVVSGSRNSIIVSGKAEEVSKETPPLLEVVGKEQPKELVLPVADIPTDSQVLNYLGHPTKFLAMFTANYCGPCRVWKDTTKKDLERMGYVVREYEMTDPSNQLRYGSQIKSVPSFVVCDWNTGKWLCAPVVGTISTPTAVSMLGVVQQQAAAPVQTTEYRSSQGRYYSYGGRVYDLETYGRCSMRNCGMCAEISAAQQRYRQSKVLINKVGPQASSPDDVVAEALALMRLNRDSVFCDLGCGNGSVLIAAAKKAGCRCIGVEIDDAKVEEARRMVLAHGLSHLIGVVKGDVREFDPSHHSVTHIYAYLYEDLLKEIAGKLKSVDVAVCPGHECPGIGMKLVGQCWIRRKADEGQIGSIGDGGAYIKEGTGCPRHSFGHLAEVAWVAIERRNRLSNCYGGQCLLGWTRGC